MGKVKHVYISELDGQDLAESISRFKEALLSGRIIVIPEFGEVELTWRYAKNSAMAEKRIVPKVVVTMDSCFFEAAAERLRTEKIGEEI